MNEGVLKPIITLDKRARVDFPSYLRDKYDLLNVDYVRITDDGRSIIITPMRSNEMMDRIRELETELARIRTAAHAPTTCKCRPREPETCPYCGGVAGCRE